MKKVLVFGITENPGGVESVVMNYYRNINRENIQFDFLCNTEVVAYEDEILKLGGKIYRITARSKDRNKYKSDMEKFFKEHSNEYSSIWVNVCSLANIDYLKYAKKYGIKKRIIHSHNSQNMDSFLRGLLHRFNKLFISKYATDFWSCSDDASKWFYSKKIQKQENHLIVKNAIDLEKFKYDEKTRNEYRKELNWDTKIVFGNVGRFHFQKNQLFLIKIFAKIQKKVDNAILVLVGDGEDRNKIVDMINEYKINEKVVLLGVRDDIPNIMQAMDVFVFPSIFEGLGLVAIEAQASGLPVFASKNVIPEEVNIDKEIFRFIELDKGEEYWANDIINDLPQFINRRRQSRIELFENEGYSIQVEARKVENYLC